MRLAYHCIADTRAEEEVFEAGEAAAAALLHPKAPPRASRCVLRKRLVKWPICCTAHRDAPAARRHLHARVRKRNAVSSTAPVNLHFTATSASGLPLSHAVLQAVASERVPYAFTSFPLCIIVTFHSYFNAGIFLQNKTQVTNPVVQRRLMAI